MNAIELFKTRHTTLHGGMLRHFLTPIQETDLRKSPYPGVTPILWMLWHIARVEDIGLSRFVADVPQLMDENWLERMAVKEQHYGTSMTEVQVLQLSETASVKGVLDYYAAVGSRTESLLDTLTPDLLDEVLSEERVRDLIEGERIGGPGTEWVIPNYVGKSKGWCMTHFGLTHGFYHLGQAYMVRKMLGYAPMGS